MMSSLTYLLYNVDEAGRDLAGGGVASGGLRELIPTIARTAVAAGVDGLFMEVHDDPTSSPVDGPTQWPLRNFRRVSAQHHCPSYLRVVLARPLCVMKHRARCGPHFHVGRHLTSSLERRALLEELIAIAGVTKGRQEFVIDLRPVGEEFDPMQL